MKLYPWLIFSSIYYILAKNFWSCDQFAILNHDHMIVSRNTFHLAKNTSFDLLKTFVTTFDLVKYSSFDLFNTFVKTCILVKNVSFDLVNFDLVIRTREIDQTFSHYFEKYCHCWTRKRHCFIKAKTIQKMHPRTN